MTQQRVYDFGALLTQGRTKALATSLFTPGIYGGFDPIVVSPALLQLTAGSLLLPDGVLDVESTNVDLTPPIVVGDYTLTADHDDIQAVGGSPVVYTFRSGILPRSGSPNPSSLAVFWLRYTGGPITASMFSTPPKVKNGTVLDDLVAAEAFLAAPFGDAADVVKGSNITINPTSDPGGAPFVGWQITNSAASGLQALQFTLRLPALPRTRRIEVYANLPNNASIGFRTMVMTLTLAAVAGPSQTVTVSSTAGFAPGDKVAFYDSSTGLREVTTIIAVTTGFTFVAALVNGYNIGSTVRSLCRVVDGANNPVVTTPSVINGPLSGLSSPIGTFVLDNSAADPVTMGVNISLQPGGSGVFLRGFRLVGD